MSRIRARIERLEQLDRLSMAEFARRYSDGYGHIVFYPEDVDWIIESLQKGLLTVPAQDRGVYRVRPDGIPPERWTLLSQLLGYDPDPKAADPT